MLSLVEKNEKYGHKLSLLSHCHVWHCRKKFNSSSSFYKLHSPVNWLGIYQYHGVSWFEIASRWIKVAASFIIHFTHHCMHAVRWILLNQVCQANYIERFTQQDMFFNLSVPIMFWKFWAHIWHFSMLLSGYRNISCTTDAL